MSESLRNDGRIWVPKKMEDVMKLRKHEIKPSQISEEDRDYYLERRYPAFGNLVPRDVASRAAKVECDKGHGVSPTGLAVYLDFSEAILRYGKMEANKQGMANPSKEQLIVLGEKGIADKYGNLFEMYEKITGINAYKEPMKISPAAHFSMGGLWVDYELMTTIPGLYAIGECNYSDHGANRLGANSLLQASIDGEGCATSI